MNGFLKLRAANVGLFDQGANRIYVPLDDIKPFLSRHLEYWQAMRCEDGCASLVCDTCGNDSDYGPHSPRWHTTTGGKGHEFKPGQCSCTIGRAIAEINEVLG